ncbi:von Willebrand factor type A domain-containing protein [Streptomyces sp. NPDC101118]|uniref:vWA domain-containing protein n=1 Tax=Streptomyces sp. NPDC101118 TaxID=3366109 RepID=UPI0037F7D878
MELCARKYGRVLAVTLAGGLLVTGCGGGSSVDGPDNSYQRPPRYAAPESGGVTGGGVTGGGAQKGGAAQGAAQGTTEGAREGEDDGLRPSAPPADYLSTFGLDVDTAGYGYARRALGQGRLPEAATVRPEEFVNSFRQDYPRPQGDGFSVTVDGAATAEPGWSLVRVGLATRDGAPASERPPAALTFVVDVSGSMAEPGRLDLVRSSLALMLDRLRDDDSVALVTFSSEATTLLPMTRLAGARERIRTAVDALRTADSTNVEAGVARGYDVAVAGRRAGATNRVVLLSDALANTGATTADAILERIEGARRAYGITLSGVGVGSEYGDELMERLADRGDGHTTYVSDTEEARTVFCEQLPAQVELRARDAKAQVAFDPATVERFRLVGYENRKVADGDFRNDRVDGGEVGAGHTVTALYAVRLRAGASGHVATATVRWLDPRTRAPHEESGRVEASSLAAPLWSGSNPRLQVSAVAAYLADALRARSGGWEPLPGAVAPAALTGHAERLARGTEDEDVRRLAAAVRQASSLLG